MANPWDQDEIVAPSPAAGGGNPWDADPIVAGAPDFSNVQSGASSVSVAPPAPAKPSLFRLDSDFRERSGVGMPATAWAAARDMFGSRKGAAEFLAEQAGGAVEQDERGEPIVRLPDGTAYRLNDPGLDSTDIGNVVGNVAAFLTPAGIASRFNQARRLGLASRAATQGGAAAATDVALQAGFDEGRVDPVRTLAATAGGGGGEVLGTAASAVARRGVNAFNSMTGRNNARAVNVLAEQGLTPTPQAVNALAARIPELEAGANPNALIGAQRYGFTYTQGQRAMDPRQQFDLLSQEELLRQSPAGGHILREAATRNAEQLDNALVGITRQVGGQAGAAPSATPAQFTQGAAGRLQTLARDLDDRVSDAYQAAGQGGRTAVSSEAVRDLPRILQTSVADFAPNPTTTPVTAKTLEQMRAAADAITTADGGKVAGVTLKALETQRRILNNNINAAANRADRAAMVKIKREFDSWMDDAVDTALVSGDPAALQSIKEARALRAEFGRRFEGSTDADRFIGGLLDGTRTPEELVNVALGASQVSKAGGARFIERLRVAAGGDPEVIGNLRAAHFLRLSRGNDGQPLPMGQIIRNIRSSDYNNASVVKALYSPEQWAEIRRLAASMEPLVARGDFARTSGTAERLARMLGQSVSGGVGDLPIVRGILQGARDVRQMNQARAALNQPLRLPGASGATLPAATATLAKDGTR
jgi:hypothetical protein